MTNYLIFCRLLYSILVVFLIPLVGVFVLLIEIPQPCINHDGHLNYL